MIDMDPPRHDELRGLIARRFTPRAVDVWEDQVRTVTREVLDRALPMGEFDFVQEIVVGDPDAGVRRDPRRAAGRAPRDHRPRRPAARQPGPRVRGRARRGAPQLPFSARPRWRCSSSAAGWPPSGASSRATTSSPSWRSSRWPSRSSTSTSCCWRRRATRRRATRSRTGCSALLEHPEELERLRGRPRRWARRAAEEMLRWATPVHHFRRTAAVDTELAGTQIKAGDKVTTWFVSGNRDETVFEEPGRLRPRAATPNRAHGVRARRHPPLHGRAPGARWRSGSRSRSCSRA